MEKMEDNSLMPFGQFQDCMMEEVPVSYFHWLWFNGKKNDMTCPVADYIRRNMTSLKAESNDLIWD